MKRKRQRLFFVVFGVGLLSAAVALALIALGDSVVFFHSPSDVAQKSIKPGTKFRLGGLVQTGSRGKLADGVTITFRVTDCVRTIPVHYRGVLPDLFREGQGVVAEGSLRSDGVFAATRVLAKHDENYMPPEVAKGLKKGHMEGEKRCRP